MSGCNGPWFRQRVTEWAGLLDLTMGISNMLAIVMLAMLYPQSRVIVSAEASPWCDSVMIVSLVSQFISSLTFFFDFFKPLEKSRHFVWQFAFYLSFTGVGNLVIVLWTFVGSQTHPERCGGQPGDPALYIGGGLQFANATALLMGSVLFRQYQLRHRHAEEEPSVVDPAAVAEQDVNLAAAMDASLRDVSRVVATSTTINVDDFEGLQDVPTPTASIGTIQPATPAATIVGPIGHAMPVATIVGSIGFSVPGAITEEKHSVQQNDAIGTGATCSICLHSLWPLTESSKAEPVRAVVACGHCFHAKCLMPWILRGKNTCPNCRGPVIHRKRPQTQPHAQPQTPGDPLRTSPAQRAPTIISARVPPLDH